MIVVGLSHHTAPLAIRERLAVTGDSLFGALDRLHRLESVAEVVMLSTCNRVEVYAAAHPQDTLGETVTGDVIALLAEMGGREVVPHLMSANGSGAIEHLFRVASSLESLVVGEPQILGQLKEAIRTAEQRKLIGPRLTPVLRHALQVGKRVRTETEIGSGQVSIPTVAIDLAHRIFDDLRGHVALLVGAGEMAEAAAKLLARHGARLLVVNRSTERAVELAAAVGGEARDWKGLAESLVETDIVVASTASREPVITKTLVSSIRKKRRGRSLFLIDIAVPRDVESKVNELENVYLYDIDDLSRVVAETLQGRAAEAARAETIVGDETKSFLTRRSQETVTPVIVGLRERTRRALVGELERSLNGRLKHLAQSDREALLMMMNAAENKLLHEPTARLKALAMRQESDEAARVLTELFDLEQAVAEAEQGHETEVVVADMDDQADAERARRVATR